jgi:hypothetical protein
MWPVSTRANKSGQGDDDPSLIEAIEVMPIAYWLIAFFAAISEGTDT